MTQDPSEVALNVAAAREANDRGAALAHQERYRESAAAFDEACSFDPEYADAFSNLGAVLRRLGDIDAAIENFSEAIRLQPDFAAAHYNLGNAFSLKGDKTAAADAYRSAISHREDYAEAWNNLARLLNDGGHHAEALEACLEGLKHTPDNPHLRNNTGNAYQGLGRLAAAGEQYRRAIEKAPDMSEAYSNLGVVLKEAGELDAAVEIHHKAVQLAPTDTGALNNYGASLQAASRIEDAVATFRQALEIDPNGLVTHINLGTALMDRNDVDAAIDVFTRVVEDIPLGDTTPEHALAHKNLGLSLMLKGDYAAGGRHYAWRWDTREFTARDLETPIWGGEDLKGERVLVLGEQGFGDAIQFARFAEAIAARGGTALWETPAPLAELLSTATGVDQVVVEGEPLPTHDLHIPMFDLLAALSVETDTLPGRVPYLGADPTRAERWEDRIPETGRLRVGLVWAGRPTHRNDRNRSIDLEILKPLLHLPAADFYALQVGERAGDITRTGLQHDLIDLSPRLQDFADTAAAIAQLDLIISVDTSVVHVAGALGQPAWVLIPFAPDWRWGLGRSESPWYPSLRLWRQDSPGDWTGVIDNIARALDKKARSADSL